MARCELCPATCDSCLAMIRHYTMPLMHRGRVLGLVWEIRRVPGGHSAMEGKIGHPSASQAHTQRLHPQFITQACRSQPAPTRSLPIFCVPLALHFTLGFPPTVSGRCAAERCPASRRCQHTAAALAPPLTAERCAASRLLPPPAPLSRPVWCQQLTCAMPTSPLLSMSCQRAPSKSCSQACCGEQSGRWWGLLPSQARPFLAPAFQSNRLLPP